MHEIGIARQILRTVEKYAGENGADEIAEVVCDCGELSLVIPEYLEKTYPMVIKGTILQNAKLTLNTVPGLAECDDCDEIDPMGDAQDNERPHHRDSPWCQQSHVGYLRQAGFDD